MKKSIFLSLVLAITLTLSSCVKDDEPNFHFVPLQIQSADLPDSFSLNETYQIDVTYTIPDGCTGFSGFDVTSGNDTTTRNVVVIGTTRTDQDACTQATQEATGTFNFRVVYSDTYLFRFWQGEDEEGNQQYLEIEVPVM